jgi:Calcineurin-like phosphoesterase
MTVRLNCITPPDAPGYDIIGDVHGCADTLTKLLEKMGYVHDGRSFKHRERIAVFVGDIVDRGPHIRQALHLVKDMVDSGAAYCIMGNHEFNAIAYTTLAPAHAGQTYLREHSARNNRLIAETLEQFAHYRDEWHMFLDWFHTLPLFIETPSFRVVHACWDEKLISQYKQRYGTNLVSKAVLAETVEKGSFAWQVMDRLTRGTDIRLPKGVTITSRDGYVRDAFRTKFWAKNPKTYRDVVFQPDPLPEELANRHLTEHEMNQLLRYDAGAVPVFVGHYWLQGVPRQLRRNVACLDYSAVKFGRLVAYRFDGEAALNAEKFVWVYVDPEA